MRLKSLVMVAVVGAVLTISQTSLAKKKGAKSHPVDDKTPLVQLNLRISALEAIDAYQLTTAQIESLHDIALKIAAPNVAVPDPPDSKALSNFHAALIDLLTALENGTVAESKLDDLKKKVDEAAEAAKYGYPATSEPGDAARKAAADFSLKLKAPQLASAMSLFSDHVTDPVELMVNVSEAKKAAKADGKWAALRDAAATEVGYLIAGSEATAAKGISTRVAAWLDAAADVDAPLPDAQRAAVDESASKTLGPVDTWAVLHHWSERDVARLISNPQLIVAIESRQQTNDKTKP